MTTEAFKTRRIGRTTLEVSELGLGSAALAGNHQFVAEADARGAIETTLAAGVRFADTAPFYGFGKSERWVGDGLRHREGWVVSTKAGRMLAPGPATGPVAGEWFESLPFHPVYDYGYDAVMRSYEDSLQRLGLDHIDILLLHDIGAMQHGEEANRALFRDAMEGGYKALDELRSSGAIKAIGLGVNEREVCLAALEHGQWDCFLLAGRYTLLEQAPMHDLLPACKAHGASIILGGPYNSGVLAGGANWNYAKAPPEIVEKVTKIRAVCDAHGVPTPAAALQFPLGHDVVSTVIPGPRSAAEAAQNLEYFRMPIDPSLWSDLKSEGLMDKDAPTPG